MHCRMLWLRRRAALLLLGLPGGLEALLETVKAQDQDPYFRNGLPDNMRRLVGE